ncbi:hypothetical protein HDU87_002873 [Geranomyces variabilis]|uniref:Uncharacterized protein n=1 Tax=Geranomyces variabilis TaxID=109894 RepID=A0AAD5TLW8_9FUNG|nr:hypothetical protein HDU87_002873 [Geranomyces variabilis]
MGIFQLAFSAVLASTAISGAKRAANLDFDGRKIENECLRNVVNSYMRVGDWVLDVTTKEVKRHSDYFVPAGKPSSPRELLPAGK